MKIKKQKKLRRHSLHDRFFRHAMTEKKVAKAFLQNHLPSDIKRQVDFDSLRLEPDTYVEKGLTLLKSDVLFSAKIGGKNSFIYVLVEHQSTCDKMMPLRMWKYVLSIMEAHQNKKNEKPLPLVYPIVLYAGRRPYHASQDIKALVNAPDKLIERIFLQPFRLVDLTQLSDEEITKQAWSGVMEFVLKHTQLRTIEANVHTVIELLDDLIYAGAINFMLSTVKYVAYTTVAERPQELIDIIFNSLEEKHGDKMGITLAEYMNGKAFEQGIVQGIEQGIERGSLNATQTVARRMINRGQSLEMIADITGLPLQKIKQLQVSLQHQLAEEG